MAHVRAPPGQKLAPAADAVGAVDRLDVVVEGVGRDAELEGELLFARPRRQTVHHLPLPGRQARTPIDVEAKAKEGAVLPLVRALRGGEGEGR